MITGSQVRNEEFQPNGNPWFPAWELAVSNLGTGLLSKTKRSVPDQKAKQDTAVPCNGNLWFQGWEPGVPISVNRQFLATVTSANPEFLAMVTHGSQLGN